jgi:hypothetical protein
MAAAVLLVVALVLTIAPVCGAETVTPDDTARFLAGLPPASDSPLAALANDARWQRHARFFDSLFEREDATTLSKVRAFAQEHLTEKHDAMLYMFSGPDFLYATSFFPNASTYVLAGLEPAGDVSHLTALSRPVLDYTLQNIESSIGTLMNYSFFITHNMKTQLSAGPIYGTLPILYVFLARTGKTIHDVTFVDLDGDGNIQTWNESGGGKRANSAASGVRIVFSAGNGPWQTLYYFSTNLADGGVARSGFLTFCGKLGTADSFIKSASYLLHSGGFNKVRDFLLEHSAAILQDDSGIPVVYFDPKKWRLRPFGHYVAPLSIFAHAYQPRMAELFRKAAPIDFGLGYRWRKKESNLLLAQKIATGTTESGLSPRYSPIPDNQPETKEISPRPHPPNKRRINPDSSAWGWSGGPRRWPGPPRMWQ